jgi:integration host factor subunit beta
MNDLNLDELSRLLAEREGLPASEIRRHLREIIGLMTRVLDDNGRIEIRGLGSFRTRERKARWSRNISKGTAVFVPPHRAPVFLCGSSLKTALNGPKEEKIEKTPEKA